GGDLHLVRGLGDLHDAARGPRYDAAVARARARMTNAVPAISNAIAGTAAAGGVSPSASAARIAASGTVNSPPSATIVGLIDRSTRLNSECPTSWPSTM